MSNAFHVNTLFNEETTVEKELLEHLCSLELGWTYKSRDELASLRSEDREVLLLPILRKKLIELNPHVINSNARCEAILTKLRAERDNQEWLKWLHNEQTYTFDPSEKAQNIKLIDYKELDNNYFLVTNQFPVEGNPNGRPDIVLFVNGIPIVVIEAKTASRNKPDWRLGAQEIGEYSQEIEQLFYSNMFGVGVNEVRMMYGVPQKRLQFWLQWSDPWPHDIDEFDEMKVSLYGLFDRQNLLDILRYFVLYVTRDGKSEKIIVRYQQFRAVKDVLNRSTVLSTPPDQRRGLIWHTQGSGKTLTMIFAARSLWEQEKLTQPTIIILVDREQLEEQMSRELFATSTENLVIAGSKRELEELLIGDYRGVILTTVHKFEGMPKDICHGRKNIIIMADEAHRTQEGDLGTYMRGALPEASLFGFTGTPIENDDHNTPAAWGKRKNDGTIERYMGKPYTVNDAMRDAVVKPIHWQPRVTGWQLAGNKLDIAFNREFGHLPESERKRLVTREAKLDALIRHPLRISQVVEDIVQHFTEHVRPNSFKAMLVCRDKESVRLYYEALTETLGTERVVAVISESPQKDPNNIQALYLGAAKRKQILEQYLLPSDTDDKSKPYTKVEILVVCDMLLTGFDAPICQTMYLDKGIKNHTLLQAIARVNRPYNELKGNGLVLDYYGIFDDLNEALNYRPEELGDAVHPFDQLRQHFQKQIEALWSLFPEDQVPRDGSHDSFIQAMKIIRDTDGAEKQFNTGYRNLKVLYEALQPDEFLRDYIRPYAWLTKLYLLYLRKFYPESAIEVTKEDAARTRELIREHISVDEIERDFPTYVLDENFLTKVKDKKLHVKALDIEAMLTAELRIRIDQDENFRPLSEHLQRLIDEKRAGTLAGIALIEELEKLTVAVKDAIDESKRPIGQTLAMLIKSKNPTVTGHQAATVAAAVLAEADKKCFSGWWNQSSIDTDLTREIVLMLVRDYGNLNLLMDGTGLVNKFVLALKRKHYRP